MNPSSKAQHLTRLADLSDHLLDDLLEMSERSKSQGGSVELSGKTVGMLFFRRSLRTRASFEVAVHQLGGRVVNLTGMSDLWELEAREGVTMDGRSPEHVRDAAAVLSSYVNALAIRPAPLGQSWQVDRRDDQIRTWARHASVPVINMESALWHPLQAMADVLTLREAFGALRGKRLTIVWVHSPVPASAAVVHSLLHATLCKGMQVQIAHPPGFELDGEVLEQAAEIASANGGSLSTCHELGSAVEDTQVVYARSWQSLESYGNPTLAASQRARLTQWRVDRGLLESTADARVMHAMPVRRNVEITDSVLDSPRSLLYQQAENRLYVQRALLQHLLG